MKLLHSFFRKDEGQDLVEYALLASFISIVAVVTIRAIGPLVRVMYQNIQAVLT
jgi:Flp pilus assembly pilin Flp